ncbi:uncharacterized protein LOC109709982 [Ananas comosus]|uniref:Uncharacterized protein LOC109709982 n=1 Tax=Ananas comosus TaxID=4615 RepID=A0A6P5EWV0_ANACO|nr:uncharacterized protein LOC109709982 [Ananas comosus]
MEFIGCRESGDSMQFVGPTGEKSGGILGGWLGIIARRPNLCPIHYPSWKVLPLMFKTKLLLLTRSKLLFPSNGNIEKWVLKSLSRKWKNFKCGLKGKYIIDNYTEQEVASNVPSGFTSQQWIDLVRYWFSEKSKPYSQIGKVARAKHITPHTTGFMSFARKRDQFEKENGREPGRVEFFALTDKRKNGTYDESSQEVLCVFELKVTGGGNSNKEDVLNHVVLVVEIVMKQH